MDQNSPLHPKALRYLAAVAALGSVQAAAREIAISASAIDRQIMMLEEDLGVPLFERLPRGMRLTAAGEMMVALSLRWKADLNRTLSDVKHMQGVNQGQLRLAAMDSHANGFLPGFIHSLVHEHPGIVLEVDIVSTADATRNLIEGHVDLAIAFNLKPQRELHVVWTTDLPLGCVVATGHPLAGADAVSLKEVAVWPLAIQSHALAIRHYLERRHAWLLREARPPLVTNSLQLVKALVSSGSHVALTSELDAGPEILAGSARFIPLSDGNAQPQTMGVAISANRPIARMGRIAADLLADYAATYLADVRRAGHS